jgi:hypothetical protein
MDALLTELEAIRQAGCSIGYEEYTVSAGHRRSSRGIRESSANPYLAKCLLEVVHNKLLKGQKPS